MEDHALLPRTAVVTGATGLVGGEVVRRLLDDPLWTEVVVLARKDLHLVHPKLKAHKVDLDKLEACEALIQGDDFFCCIGTTMKKAGNQEAFYASDFDVPYELARAASRNGMKRFLLVTSIGADQSSPVFYSRVKGELERAVSQVPFSAVHLLRPSLLLGDRNEERSGEKWATRLAPLLSLFLLGPLRKYRPIQASDVAKTMVLLAKSTQTGALTHESDEIQVFAS